MIEPMGTLSNGLFALAGGIAASRPRAVSPGVPPDRSRDPARVPENHQWPLPPSGSAIPLRIVAAPIAPAPAPATRRKARSTSRSPGLGQGALFDA
jgi:hypothetical protein